MSSKRRRKCTRRRRYVQMKNAPTLLLEVVCVIGMGPNERCVLLMDVPPKSRMAVCVFSTEQSVLVEIAAAKGVQTKFRMEESAFAMGQRGILALLKDVPRKLSKEDFV